MSATQVPSDTLALQRLYHWERTSPDHVMLTQPMGGGVVREFTWKQVLDQTRRMAAHLKSQGIAPGDRVALLSKNTAWWLMADWAIWMVGGVSVPLYPTLAADTIRQILDAQRVEAAVRRQARRLGRHEARRAGRRCRASRCRWRRRRTTRNGTTSWRAPRR